MKMTEIEQFDSWAPEQIPEGFVCEAGTSELYITGGWRSMRPVWDQDKCTSCIRPLQGLRRVRARVPLRRP